MHTTSDRASNSAGFKHIKEGPLVKDRDEHLIDKISTPVQNDFQQSLAVPGSGKSQGVALLLTTKRLEDDQLRSCHPKEVVSSSRVDKPEKRKSLDSDRKFSKAIAGSSTRKILDTKSFIDVDDSRVSPVSAKRRKVLETTRSEPSKAMLPRSNESALSAKRKTTQTPQVAEKNTLGAATLQNNTTRCSRDSAPFSDVIQDDGANINEEIDDDLEISFRETDEDFQWQYGEKGHSLRFMAREERSLMKLAEQCLKISEEDRDWEEVSQWKQRIAEHHAKAETYEESAASDIFKHHNPNYSFCKDRLDLHGLRVKEADKYVREHLNACGKAGVWSTTIITGRGNRSKDGIPRLKPALLRFVDSNGFRYQVHAGHVVVKIDPD